MPERSVKSPRGTRGRAGGDRARRRSRKVLTARSARGARTRPSRGSSTTDDPSAYAATVVLRGATGEERPPRPDRERGHESEPEQSSHPCLLSGLRRTPAPRLLRLGDPLEARPEVVHDEAGGRGPARSRRSSAHPLGEDKRAPSASSTSTRVTSWGDERRSNAAARSSRAALSPLGAPHRLPLGVAESRPRARRPRVPDPRRELRELGECLSRVHRRPTLPAFSVPVRRSASARAAFARCEARPSTRCPAARPCAPRRAGRRRVVPEALAPPWLGRDRPFERARRVHLRAVGGEHDEHADVARPSILAALQLREQAFDPVVGSSAQTRRQAGRRAPRPRSPNPRPRPSPARARTRVRAAP